MSDYIDRLKLYSNYTSPLSLLLAFSYYSYNLNFYCFLQYICLIILKFHSPATESQMPCHIPDGSKCSLANPSAHQNADCSNKEIEDVEP